MSGETMRTFSFDGNTLEEIHGWMQKGRGLDGIQPAIEALSGLARDLENSMDSLREALTAIGAWAGPAGDGADGATRQGGEWVVMTTPQVTDSAQSTDGVASGFVSTRARMPSPSEAELTDGERSVVSAVPIVGPILDRQAADAKRDRVTNEARQRMRDWQDGAQGSVGAVQPLPPVPQPAVDVAPPRPQGSTIDGGPDQTALAGLQPGPSAPAQPASPPPGTGGPIPSGPSGPPAVGSPTPPPGGGRPVVPAPQPPVATPPIAQPPAPGRVPAAGMPLFPFPVGGVGGGDAAGRRRAYGPGVFNAEEIARSRGGSGAGVGTGKGGVLGGVPDDGTQGRHAASKGAPLDVDEHARGRGAAGAGGGPAGRTAGSGSIMQPAVGGARKEDDAEHSDKYAVKSDEYFAGDPHRVAPPVIGG